MTLPTQSRITSGRFLRLLLVALSLGLLTSCSTTGTVLMPVPKVLPEESCLSLAEALPLLSEPTIPALVQNHLQTVSLYWQLAARQKCLVEFERAR